MRLCGVYQQVLSFHFQVVREDDLDPESWKMNPEFAGRGRGDDLAPAENFVTAGT